MTSSEKEKECQAGYYEEVKAITNIQEGEKIVSALYKNSLFRESYSLCSVSNSGQYYSVSTNSDSKSAKIPLYKYDSDGNMTAILNTIKVVGSVYNDPDEWGGNTGRGSASFSLVTDKNATIGSGSSGTYNYNMFGMNGLDGVKIITLNANVAASVSVTTNHAAYTPQRSSSASIKYELEYVDIELTE